MSTNRPDCISPIEVTNLIGKGRDAVYKQIRRKKIKTETTIVDGKKEYLVPTHDLLITMEDKAAYHRTELTYLEKGIQILKDHIRNAR